MIIPSFLLAAAIASPAASTSASNDDAIATCFVEDEEVASAEKPHKTFLALQFDRLAAGALAESATRIHDPGRILSGRRIEQIKNDSTGITIYLVDPATMDRRNGAIIGLIQDKKNPAMFTLSVGFAQDGKLGNFRFGSCSVKAYAGGSDLMFEVTQRLNAEGKEE